MGHCVLPLRPCNLVHRLKWVGVTFARYSEQKHRLLTEYGKVGEVRVTVKEGHGGIIVFSLIVTPRDLPFVHPILGYLKQI